jgi:type II secretory pathway component PulF
MVKKKKIPCIATIAIRDLFLKLLHMYEKKTQPLASQKVFFIRLGRNLFLMLILILFSLLIGVIGYYYLAEASWIDAFHNASMILSGMGPVITIASETGKIFSSFYALFSGLVFVTNVGVLLAPVMHRIMHRIHLEA